MCVDILFRLSPLVNLAMLKAFDLEEAALDTEILRPGSHNDISDVFVVFCVVHIVPRKRSCSPNESCRPLCTLRYYLHVYSSVILFQRTSVEVLGWSDTSNATSMDPHVISCAPV